MFPASEQKETAWLVDPGGVSTNLFRTYNILPVYNTIHLPQCEMRRNPATATGTHNCSSCKAISDRCCASLPPPWCRTTSMPLLSPGIKAAGCSKGSKSALYGEALSAVRVRRTDGAARGVSDLQDFAYWGDQVCSSMTLPSASVT